MGFILRWLAALASQVVVVAVLKRVFVALGLSAVSYVGVLTLFNAVDGWISSELGQVSSSMMAVLNMAGFTNAVSVVVSAWFTRLTMKGLTAAGALTKISWRGANSLVLTP